MPTTHLAKQLAALAIASAANLCVMSALAADEELTLLSIEGNLIGKIETLDETTEATLLIQSYYALLTESLRDEVESMHEQLIALIPYYEVAFTAADSAEITEVKSDIDLLWLRIRTVHAQQFTPEVTELLNSAYNSAFSTLGLKPESLEPQ